MTIDEMHKFQKFLANVGQNGYFPPEDRDRAINQASFDKFNEEKRLFEVNGYISDNLRPFNVSSDISLSSGLGSLPSDYDYRISASDASDKEVEIVESYEWLGRINSEIAPPSTTYPVLCIRNQVEVRPTSITSVKLYYLKEPLKAKWGYTVSSGRYIHNASASTDLDWPDSAHGDIVLRSLPYLGVPLNDEVLTRFKSFKQQTENV